MSDVVRALDAHTAARDALESRVLRVVAAMVGGFDGWYDHAAITALSRRVVVQVEAAQRATATVTDAYLSRVASSLAGRQVLPVGPVDPAGLRQGVAHDAVYGRLADQYRYRSSLGEDPEQVREGVLTRAAAMVVTDLALSAAHQSRRFMVVRSVDGYRRVLRPEMTRTGVCGLCVAASDRVYNRRDLLPMHSNCHCAVLPIVNGQDPGRSLNQDELDRLYDDAGSTRAGDLIRTKYRVETNGELGPTLVQEGHRFRGPAAVA